MAMNAIPASEISHRVNAKDHGAYVYIASMFMLVTSVSFLLVRLVIRWPWKKLMGLDDLLSLLATVFSVVHTGLLILSVRNGLGKRQQDLSREQHKSMNHAFYATNILYAPGIACAQIAVGTLILRLLRLEGNTITALERLALAIYVTIGLIAAWTVAGIIVFAIPLGSGSATSTDTQVTAMTIIEVFSLLFDMPLLGVPISLIWSLHLAASKKIAILSGFVIRLLFHVLAIPRIIALHSASTSSDVTMGLASPAVLSAIELNLIIVGATLPCLSTFLRMMNSGGLAITAMGPASSLSNSYALKSQSRQHNTTNEDRAMRRQWEHNDGDLSPGVDNYQVQVEGGEVHDDTSIASFGSRQAIIWKTVEATVDTIGSDSPR